MAACAGLAPDPGGGAPDAGRDAGRVDAGGDAGSDAGPGPLTLALRSGDGQAGLAGAPLPAPLVVVVTDGQGQPVPGVAVDFAAVSGGGGLPVPGAVSDALGTASALALLGDAPGENVFRASAAGAAGGPVLFHARGYPAAALGTDGGEAQVGVSGAVLAQPLVVVVSGADGGGLPGRPVSFRVAAGGGALWGADPVTDAQGRARAWLVLGPDGGPQEVEASGPGLSPAVRFTATGRELLLVPAAAGAAHQQDLALPAPVAAEVSATDGLPAGLALSAGGLGGTPAEVGTFSLVLHRRGPGGFADDPRAALTVVPALTAARRRLLVQQATRPMEVTGACAADLGTVARLDEAPGFVFEPEPYFAGTPNASTQTGRLPDGGLTAGRRFLEATLAAVVPVLTGQLHGATFTDVRPDGGVLIRVAPVVNLGASGDRLTSEVRLAPGRVPDAHLHGNGRILSGTLWLPESWFLDAPATTWEADQRNDVLVHELGHVLNGPHPILPGAGFVQQRLRRQLRPLGPSGDPLHTLDQEEAAIYALVYRTPVGTSFEALVRAGLLVPADATPAPVLQEAVVMLSSDAGLSWESPATPIRAGSRVALFGGQLKGPWEDVYCVVCPWAVPTVQVTTASGLAPVARLATTWVGDPDQRLEVVLPLDAVTGPVVVETSAPGGCARSSGAFQLTVVP